MTTITKQIMEKEFGIDSEGNSVSIADKYQQLKNTIIKLYDERVWFLTDAALSVVVSCLLVDIANPVSLIFVDGPSSEKTTVLDFFDGLPMSYRLDKFTPASFLTQAGNVKKKDLKHVDLLSRIPYKTLLIPEMATIFNQPKEMLLETYGTLTRVLDGTGLVNAGGVHGERSLTGDYMFGLLGATTPLDKNAWNTMGKVGCRLVFLNAPARRSRRERLQRAKNIITSRMHYKQKKKAAKEAVSDFLNFFMRQLHPIEYELPEDVPANLDSEDALMQHCGYLPRSVNWDGTCDDQSTIETIALLGEFLTSARKEVRVWSERTDGGGSETNSTGAVTEGVERFTAIIYNLARSHALVSGRKGVNKDDLPLLITIAFSSLPDDRNKAIQLLFDPTIPHKKSELGKFTVKELQESMSCTDKTAKIIMTKLKFTEIGQLYNGGGTRESEFVLDEDYNWFLTEEFRQLYRVWDKPQKANALTPF